MKEFELFEIAEFQFLKITQGDRSWTAEAKDDNPFYQEYLRYTEWVEAGNNPEDFWTRDLDSPEGLEQTQVTEEEETPQETEGES